MDEEDEDERKTGFQDNAASCVSELDRRPRRFPATQSGRLGQYLLEISTTI